MKHGTMQHMVIERVDIRSEWYREWYQAETSGWVYRLPRIYWLGMLSSAIWLVVYLLIYPSLPLPGGHWEGLGVPGGCQPWTALCELGKAESELEDVRGKYLKKVSELSVADLAQSSEMREFIGHAARVRYVDQCSGCHGVSGEKFAWASPPALPLNWIQQGAWMEKKIKRNIMSSKTHPFGLVERIEEIDAKMLAIYVGMISVPAESLSKIQTSGTSN